jgi:1-phosphofructokinase
LIYTVTLNPSIDYFVELEHFAIGKTNRISHEAKQPGGKGINVSRVLQRLDVESRALGFIGGFTGKYVQDVLQAEQIKTDFIHVSGDTRINIKLRTDTETEMNGLGPTIAEQDVEVLFSKLESLTENDTLVLSGNIPGSLPEDLYERIVNRLAGRGVRVVVDTTKDFLLPVLTHGVFLIKPNQDEIGEIFHKSLRTIEEIVPYGKKMVDMGAQNTIVSMGGKGALFFNKDQVLYANAPRGELRNSVGAGDSMVAGFLAAYLEGKGVSEAFRYAVAAGSASAFSEGFCTKSQIDQLTSQINITQL